MNLDAMQDILAASRREGKPMWQIVLETDMENRGVTARESLEKMAKTWRAMVEASDAYAGQRRSHSGLAGGQGEQMREYAARGGTIGGDFTAQVIAEALAMGESNACMRRIVAAPTAGACGVMPAVLIPLWRRENIPEERMVQALLVASGIGAVVAYRACIAGASGGCQAEVGTASAMAAGALVCLRGGSAEQVCHAVAMALKNLLGLVCDPVAGLVEVPCIKRNVIGAMNAIAAADMALAGIESRIPVDEDAARGGTIGGDFTAQVIAEALAMGESNACMRRIVAAPTAGACGVMPAVLIPLWRRENIPEERMVQALLVASGIGAVVAYRACIAGASGGCQAEVGTASAMAAGALVCLRGGSAEQVCHAVAMALKNLLGLVCDPVAGLVEVPCIKRNVIGAMNAIAAADMALAGIESRIPVDEVIDAMGDVGRRLPVEFRETALGGLAVTPTGKEVKERLAAGRRKQRTLTIKDAKFHIKREQ